MKKTVIKTDSINDSKQFFKDLMERAAHEAITWRIKYRMNPRTGFDVKSRSEQEALLNDYQIPVSKELLDEVWNDSTASQTHLNAKQEYTIKRVTKESPEPVKKRGRKKK